MKIVCISDSHGSEHLVKEVAAMHRTADCLVFCGDGLSDLSCLHNFYGAVCAVRGNCDYFCDRTANDIFRKFDADGLTVGITHGDRIGVKAGDDYALNYARQNNLDILIYGHTHKQTAKTVQTDGKTTRIFNPGSLREGSYGIIEVKNGRISMVHRSLFEKNKATQNELL